MYIFVRHGQRADNSELEKKLVETPWDPHLSKVGNQQAVLTGKALSEYLLSYQKHKELKELQITLISSPYLRCITTILRIYEELKEALPIENTIYLQHEIGEWLMPWEFKFDPNPKLKYFTEDKTELNDKYLKNKDVEIKSQYLSENLIQPEYPEEENEIYLRIERYLQELEKHITTPNQIVIVCTHQGILEQVNKYQKTIYDNWFIGYCGIVSNYKEEDKWVVDLNGQKLWETDKKIIFPFSK